jgi:hypothetical protein
MASTLLTIVDNMRNAAVAFVAPYRDPAGLRQALGTLLGELGIANPGDIVAAALESAMTAWRNTADELSGLDLNVLDPKDALADLQKKAKAVTDGIDAIRSAAAGAVSGVAGVGGAVASVLPRRLLDYILYTFLSASHPKIAGVLHLLGVLRRDPVPAAPPAFVKVDLRVFDLAQLVEAITHPREALMKVLRWGTNEFEAKTVIDGMTLLIGTIPGAQLGPEEDEFPLTGAAVNEADFVSVAGVTGNSPRRLMTFPASGGVVPTLSLVGLHSFGLGLLVPNPVNVGGGVGSLQLPALPSNFIFAVTPDPHPTGNPGLKKLQKISP